MTEETFWSIMHTSRWESYDNTQVQMHLLLAALAPLGVEGVGQFQDLAGHFESILENIFSAPNSPFEVYHDTDPNEDFLFAWGVVAKGKAVYDQALAATDADALEHLFHHHGVTEETGGTLLKFVESDLYPYLEDDLTSHYQEKADHYVAGQDLGDIRDGLAHLLEEARSLSVSLTVLRSCLGRGKYQTMDQEVAAGIAKIIDENQNHLKTIPRKLGDGGLRNLAASLRFLEEIAR